MLSLKWLSTSLILLSNLSINVRSAAYSPTLDINDIGALETAASTALKNLMSYYSPNAGGGGAFAQASTPWHESGMIWGMYMDHAKYTGDTQFMDTVTGCLVNASYGKEQDFLGGSMATVATTLMGKWNDDICWYGLASCGGGEIYGPNSIMPGSGGPWITLGVKTNDQVWQQWDNECGGGIYWSRDRNGASAPYKSLITQLESIQLGARNYLMEKNQTRIDQAKMAVDWVIHSGLGNTQTGILYDGMNAGECGKFTTHLWSYNYGLWLGALAWMHKATGNSTYMDMAAPFYDYAVLTFSGQNVTGVVTELCEPNAKCNRDQQGFKAIYVRNLAYLYRQTSNQTIKDSIRKTIDTSVQAMVQNSCDTEWNCGGNWTTDTAPVKAVRSQHVSSALLVSALGIHESNAQEGLLPKSNAGGLRDTTNGAAGLGSTGTKNTGKITSKPLGNSAPSTINQISALVVTLTIAVLVLSV